MKSCFNFMVNKWIWVDQITVCIEKRRDLSLLSFKDFSAMFWQVIIGFIINDKVIMGQVWPKPKQIPSRDNIETPKDCAEIMATPAQSQIETSDAQLQTMLNNAENEQIPQNNQEIKDEQNIVSNQTIKIQKTIKQAQAKSKETINQNINELFVNNIFTALTQRPSLDVRQPGEPQTLSSVQEQDEAKVQQLYNKLLTDFLPAEELKLIKKNQHNRTLILWLKQNPQSSAERQRDKRLKGEGYQVYSTSDLTSLFAKFQHYEQLCLNIIVFVSYSESYDSNDTFKTLIDYFILSNKLPELIVVRPPQGTKLQRYKLNINKLIINTRIVQINYQIELIRVFILDYETKQKSSCNFMALRYWHSREDLDQLIRDSDSHTMMCMKSKINLFGFGRIGEKIVERIANDTKSFQTLAYHYSSLYDHYVNQKGKTRKEYLEKVALLMIEDPVRFYLLSENTLLIDRLLMLVADRLHHVTCILLPLVLIGVKIKEQYELWNAKRTYKNEFRCYYDLHLSAEQLEMFKAGQIIENLGFIKAYLQPHKSYLNTHVVINVLPNEYSQQHDKGYCFISQSNNTLSVDQPQKKSYFAGYDSVLFNYLNSFKVLEKRYDFKQMRNIILLEYGYVARQIELKAMHDYIPLQHENLMYRPSPKQSPDLIAIIKYLSNYNILRSIEDFGDCFSLLGQSNQAIAYYDELYRRNKADMKTAPVLLAQIQEKKGFNYQLRRNNSIAIDNYYKAFNFIHRGPITPELEHIYSSTLKLMRKDGLHQKIVTFGPSVIRNGELHKNASTYSESFRLQLHLEIALAYFSLTCSNYHCSSIDSRINAHFERGLELVKQIGEYDQNVAVFYRQLGRYYLIKRQPIQGLMYLNKTLLILKSIHSEFNPILCEIYQYIAVGYIQTHDYNKAYNNIQQCISIYNSYYGQNDGHRLSCLQIEAYIRMQLGMKKQAVDVWRRQIDILRVKYGRDIGLSKKIELVESDVIGVLRNACQKERLSQSRSFLRMKKEMLAVTYCYAQIATIYIAEHQYKQAVFELTQATDMTKTELPNDRSFMMDLHLIIAECSLKQTLFEQFWDKAKNIRIELERNRIQRLDYAVKYHLLAAQAYSIDSKSVDAYNSSSKAREVAVKCYGCNTLQYCQIIDIVGRYALKAGKLNQAQNSFKESKQIRTNLMTNINLNRHTIQLFGFDFEEYKMKVRLHLCFSIENRGIVMMQKGETEQAVEIYKECLETLREVVGEFHFYTARINKELAKVYVKDRDNVTKALNSLNLALSVYENITEQPIAELLDSYSTMAKIKQMMNQLGQSIEAWSKVVVLLRKSHQLSNGLGYLLQFKRIVQLIVQHQNQNYFKMCYYLISNTFQQQKKHDTVLKVGSTDVVKTITEILALSQQLREKIKLQYYQSSHQKNQTRQIMNVQICYPTLESIKQKMEQRKKKRKGFLSPNK